VKKPSRPMSAARVTREASDRLRQEVLGVIDRHPPEGWVGFLRELMADLQARIEAAEEEENDRSNP
jgi:hypothetical protein